MIQFVAYERYLATMRTLLQFYNHFFYKNRTSTAKMTFQKRYFFSSSVKLPNESIIPSCRVLQYAKDILHRKIECDARLLKMYREHSIREVLTSLENLLQRLCCTIRFLNIIKTCAQGCVMVTAKLSGKKPYTGGTLVYTK